MLVNRENNLKGVRVFLAKESVGSEQFLKGRFLQITEIGGEMLLFIDFMPRKVSFM